MNQLIAKEHYFAYPNLSSGNLTDLKSVNVDTEKLARVAIKYNLHDYLRYQIHLFKEQVSDNKFNSLYISFYFSPLETGEKFMILFTFFFVCVWLFLYEPFYTHILVPVNLAKTSIIFISWVVDILFISNVTLITRLD